MRVVRLAMEPEGYDFLDGLDLVVEGKEGFYFSLQKVVLFRFKNSNHLINGMTSWEATSQRRWANSFVAAYQVIQRFDISDVPWIYEENNHAHKLG